MSGVKYDIFLGAFRQSDVSVQSACIVNINDYGVTGSGADESAKLQAAFDAAALLVGGGRPLVYIPPGLTINIGAANLVLKEGIDFDMRGSSMTSTVASGAALTIGRDGYLNSDAKILGLNISRDFSSDPHLFADTIGVRIINVFRPWIQHDWTSGFRRAVQLRACYDTTAFGYCAYGNVFIGRTHAKIGLSLWCEDAYDATYGSWISAMRFYSGDFEGPGTATCGSVAAIAYEIGQAPEAMTLDGLLLQNNVFYSPTFQLGGGGEPGFVSGGTVAAGMVGACYWVGDHSYRCMQSGVFGTTPLNQISTIRGATITSGTTQWVCEGLYVRSPFIFDRCGYNSHTHNSYWETGIGPFFHFVGKTAGGGHRATEVHLGGPQYNLKRLVGDRTGDREDWNWTVTGDYTTQFSKLNNLVTMAEQVGQNVHLTGTQQRLRSDNWHRRFIKGETYWQCAGLSARYVNTLWPKLASDYRIGRESILTGGGAFSQYGVLLDTTQFKRFRVTVLHKEVDEDFSGLAFVAFNANLTPLSIGSDTTGPPMVMCDRGSFADAGGTGIMVSGRDNWEIWVAVADEVKYLHISNWWGQVGNAIDGIEVDAYLDDYTTRAKPLKWKEPFTSSVENRRSDGTPTQGYFMTQGEYIINTNASGSTDSTSGWIVTSAGILAPAWATSTAVYKNELRSRNGNVYAANGNFTTGSGPTGTGAAIADGGGSWDYIAPVAVLSPVLQYRPHDPRVDLDYSPYDVISAILGTDTNSDGLSDGIDIDLYGNQTGVSYTHTISPNTQNFSVTRATGSDNGAGEFLVFGATLGNSKDYFLVVKGHCASVGIASVGLYVGLRNIGLGNQVDLTASAYAPDGFISSPIGQANGSGDVVLATRFTAPASNASGYGISVFPVQFVYPTLPQTITAYVDTLWCIDIAAAETALGISLAGLSSAELYAVINTAMMTVPPTSIKLKDTVTGLTKFLSIASGTVMVT